MKGQRLFVTLIPHTAADISKLPKNKFLISVAQSIGYHIWRDVKWTDFDDRPREQLLYSTVQYILSRWANLYLQQMFILIVSVGVIIILVAFSLDVQ